MPPQLAAKHPLPMRMAFIYEGLKRLRAVAATEDEAVRESMDQKSMRSFELASFGEARLEAGSEAGSATAQKPKAGLLVPHTPDAEAGPQRVWQPLSRMLSGDRLQWIARAVGWDSIGIDRKETILWRGMKDLNVTPKFLAIGGTELAPMSTTCSLEVAARYTRGAKTALLFLLRSSSFMNLGCDLSELSAFPHEKEYLYPALTFLQPTGVLHHLEFGGTKFVVVEVGPSFPS